MFTYYFFEYVKFSEVHSTRLLLLIWNVWDWKWFRFGILLDFWNIFIYIMSYLRDGTPRPNTNTFMCVSYTLYSHGPKVILHNTFCMASFWLQFITWAQVWNFLLVALSHCSKFWILKNFGFWIREALLALSLFHYHITQQNVKY